ncbi:MAG: hypothetical protein HZB99_02615 [Candidatus Harrisonbacteria bacterium]|nr:hypothetical protein [Candidatus Harrisonbacteria bacterium]
MSEEGAQWLREFKKFLRKEKTWDSLFLEFVSAFRLMSAGRFVASDHLTTTNKKVKIAYLGDNFRQHFLAKVEEPQAETELRISKLKKASPEAPILAELGDKAETTLASIWELLKKQPKGESGKLLTNGYANIFYVRDAKGVLWAVSVRWRSAGWSVDAISVENPYVWYDGFQVFSRNS